MPLPSTNKSGHPCIEKQRNHHQKSKTGVFSGLTKRTYVLQFFLKKVTFYNVLTKKPNECSRTFSFLFNHLPAMIFRVTCQCYYTFQILFVFRNKQTTNTFSTYRYSEIVTFVTLRLTEVCMRSKRSRSVFHRKEPPTVPNKKQNHYNYMYSTQIYTL